MECAKRLRVTEVVTKKRGCGCLGKLVVLALLGAVLAVVILDHFFNIRSNVTYYAFAKSAAPLQIRTADGVWKTFSEITPKELVNSLIREGGQNGATWSRLEVRREARTEFQKIVQSVLTASVNVIEFQAQHFAFETSFKDKFVGTTARERLDSEGFTFAITANFRDPKGKPLGLVVHQGQQRNHQFPVWTGYFFVKDGRPYFGPKSLFDETPGVLQEAVQGYPSVMKNHTVFSYLDLAPNKYFDGEKITYRALAGVRQNGSVLFVLSGDGGVMNMTEVTELGHKLNVQHATLLDGGRALQYSLRMSGLAYDFWAYNTQLNIQTKELAPQRSPVYIGVRPNNTPGP